MPRNKELDSVEITLKFRKDFVSCLTCANACIYGELPELRVADYCLDQNFQINARLIYQNNRKAAECSNYWPYLMSQQLRGN